LRRGGVAVLVLVEEGEVGAHEGLQCSGGTGGNPYKAVLFKAASDSKGRQAAVLPDGWLR
jgi:hypothetical protein